ncbi:hypothetical protein AB0C44_32630 [Micromonospora taraxaci]|uniref:hypothetical protein n=1 Tax=Micromonospora taraxaci TaxID=1316803 RepID=UPI0033F01618
MSRIAEVVVLAADAHEVMAPLTQDNDGTRPWHNIFVPIESQWAGTFGRGWAAEFTHRRHWAKLLEYLEAVPWPRPETVQVLIHDEEDDWRTGSIGIPQAARSSAMSRNGRRTPSVGSLRCRTSTAIVRSAGTDSRTWLPNR